MEKTKVIMKIDSFSDKDGILVLRLNDLGAKTRVKGLVEWCQQKYSSYVKLEMSPPYKPRTTGKESQNSHIWGHIQQIAEYTGYDIDDVEDYAKVKAVAKGYPYKINTITGEIKPVSMKGINTVEAGCLIDALHEWAAFLEIELDEGVYE